MARKLKLGSMIATLMVALLFLAMFSDFGHGQTATIAGVAGTKFREAMNQQDPALRLRMLREAEPSFNDPVSKYSVLYPSLVDAYIGVNDLRSAVNAIEQISKADVRGITEAESRMHLASAYMGSKQYDSAAHQLNSAVALLRKAADAKSGQANKAQLSLVGALAMQGEALLGSGSAQKALEALRDSEQLRKHLKLDPSVSTIRNLARAYAALGMQDEAIQNFAEAGTFAAHRVNAIERHIDVAGQAASASFTKELNEQKELLSRVRDDLHAVYGSREAQKPPELFLKEKLDAHDKTLNAEAMQKAKSDKPAPAFNLSSVTGRRIKLTDLRGKVVLLNFWDTTCKPCRAEYPHLQKIQDEFRDRGVAVLMINLDEDTAKVKPFAEKYGFSERVLLKDSSIQQAYGVGAIPHTVIIDSSGMIRFDEVGFTLDTPDVFRAEINSLLPKTH